MGLPFFLSFKAPSKVSLVLIGCAVAMGTGFHVMAETPASPIVETPNPSAKPELPPPAKDPVARVLSAGLMKGYPDGKFHPEGHVTRAELAHILVKAFNVGARTPQTSDLSNMADVPARHWAYDDIKTVLKANVMEGYRPGQFYPNQAVTRGEGFAILAQAYGVFDFNDSQVAETLAIYKDVAQLPAWSTKAIATAVHEGFINTNEATGYIYPDKPLTRGDMAFALSRYLDRTYAEFPKGQ